LKYRYGKLGILFSTLLSNTSEKIWDSEFNEAPIDKEFYQKESSKLKKTTAKNLAKWLNSYYQSKTE
jgi:hypothetical protein